MAGTITRTPCPKCKIVGGLHIDIHFIAKPIGTWSLSGAQDKTTGRLRPILKCANCTLSLVGEFDDEDHAVFNPEKADMAQLPPDGTWLIQQIGGSVILYHRHTEEEIVKYDASDYDATAKAQKTIFDSDKLDDEQKCFAHFWCGYFYAHATTC